MHGCTNATVTGRSRSRHGDLDVVLDLYAVSSFEKEGIIQFAKLGYCPFLFYRQKRKGPKKKLPLSRRGGWSLTRRDRLSSMFLNIQNSLCLSSISDPSFASLYLHYGLREIHRVSSSPAPHPVALPCCKSITPNKTPCYSIQLSFCNSQLLFV